MELKVGDHVFVNNTANPDDKEGAYIAQIKTLYDTGKICIRGDFQ